MSSIKTFQKISELLNITSDKAEKFYQKSKLAKEFSNTEESDEWFDKRLKKQIIFLSSSDYEESCLTSLKALSNFAGTDFGSSRQRDFNQKWADTTRGYLGEKAFQKFIFDKAKIKSELAHKKGQLSEFINTDIAKIKKPKEKSYKEPKKNIGIKTTKFNGMWLDIPGRQFQRSDYHILVKVFLKTNHIFSFFKKISVFKDKLLKRAVQEGYFETKEADHFFNTIPDLDKIPAYIVGFVQSANFQSNDYEYKGIRGPKHYTICAWKGRYKKDFLDDIKQKENVKEDVKFAGINKFSHDDAYIFNTGNLSWRDSDWKRLFRSL